MTAANKVFQTYELLENIISRLSPADIKRVSGVHETWQQLIQRSKAIQCASVSMPDWSPRHRIYGEYLPRYIICRSGDFMSFDRLLKPRWTKRTASWPRDRWAIDIIVPNPQVLSIDQEAEWDDRMISSYPISTVLLLSKAPSSTICAVYNKSGITLYDVLQVAKGILQTESTYHCRPRRAVNDNFVASIDVLFLSSE